MRMTTRWGAGLIATGVVLAGAPAVAAPQIGTYTYFSAQACASAGKMPGEICANAARNAAAEFEEKAPHFPTRAACEQAYGRSACEVSLRQSAAVGRGGVSFTPRQQGFRVVVRSEHDISTVPLGAGLAFASRTALRQATSIDPRAGTAAAFRRGGEGGQVFGSSSPDGPKGPLPPPVPYDPNFDCSKYIEPSSKGDAQGACAPVPNWRR